MLDIHVRMKYGNEPLKRVPIRVQIDATQEILEAATDRGGSARFDIPPTSGKILVAGVPRYRGHLEGDIRIELWSLTDSGVNETGTPGGLGGGSTAYPGMTTRSLIVDGREVLTDSEGYLVDLDDWSEGFVRAQAAAEGLALSDEHWDIIHYLRDYYAEHGVQAQVRTIIRHYKALWGPERGSNAYLHRLFPRGGPQKQGNRLAGLLRTKGEH